MATRTSPRVAAAAAGRLPTIPEEGADAAQQKTATKRLRPAGSSKTAQPPGAETAKKTLKVVKRSRVEVPSVDVLVCPCPTFVCPTISKDVLTINRGWDAKSWDADCKRGPARDSTEGLCFDLMVELREAAAREGLSIDSHGDDAYLPGNLALLNSERADALLCSLWSGEFNQKSINNLWLALAPKQALTMSLADGEFAKGHVTKKHVVELLVKHKVPFVELDTFEDLARRSREGMYKAKGSVQQSMLTMLATYVFSTEEEFTHGMDPAAGEEEEVLPRRLNKGTKPKPFAPDPEAEEEPLPGDFSPGESMDLDFKHSEADEILKAKDAVINELRAELARKQALAHAPGNAMSKKAQEQNAAKDKEIAKLRIQIKSVQPGAASGRRPAVPQGGTGGKGGTVDAETVILETFSKIGEALKILSEDNHASSSGGKLSLPYDRKIAQLDLAVSEGTYINFASFGVKALRELEMRATSKGQKVTLVGKSLQMVDELDDTQGDAGMAEWFQGLRFVASRILTEGFFGADQDMLVASDRHKFADYVAHDFVVSDAGTKLRTVNEFVRRMCSLKKPLWMPEVSQHQILFVQAMTGAARGARGAQSWEAADRPAAKNRAARRSQLKGRRQSTAVETPNRAKLSLEARKKNGTCPSRKAKAGVCPHADDPSSCKQSHECPRCPGMFHAASNCGKCRA